METKDLIGLILILTAFGGTLLLTCLSHRLRDVAFFSMVFGSLLIYRMDINFFSHYWYRGTSRGLEFSPIDILAIGVLLSSLLFPHHSRPRFYWPASFGFLLCYAAYAAFSVGISEPKIFGVFELGKIMRSLLVFLAAAVYVRTRRELTLLIWALACAVGFEGALGIKQRYVDQIYRVSGSIDHANSLSMYLCLTAPVMVAAALSNLPKVLRGLCVVSLGLAAVTILLTISRAGIPIFGMVVLGTAVFCVHIRLTWKKAIAGGLVAVLAAGMLVKSWDTLITRYRTATLEDEYFNERLEGRGVYFRLAWHILQDHPGGVGLNNWSYAVSKTYGRYEGIQYQDYDDMIAKPGREFLSTRTYAPPAHNLAVITAGEMGWAGLLVFTALWIRWGFMGCVFLRRRDPDPMLRIGVGCFFGLIGLALQSVTEWTFRQTPILFTSHIMVATMAAMIWNLKHPEYDEPWGAEEDEEEDWEEEGESLALQPYDSRPS